MTTQTKWPRRLTKALLETADDMHRSGVLDAAAKRKIIMRHLNVTKVQQTTTMNRAKG